MIKDFFRRELLDWEEDRTNLRPGSFTLREGRIWKIVDMNEMSDFPTWTDERWRVTLKECDTPTTVEAELRRPRSLMDCPSACTDSTFTRSRPHHPKGTADPGTHRKVF